MIVILAVTVISVIPVKVMKVILAVTVISVIPVT